jgi:hypothetical protein
VPRWAQVPALANRSYGSRTFLSQEYYLESCIAKSIYNALSHNLRFSE